MSKLSVQRDGVYERRDGVYVVTSRAINDPWAMAEGIKYTHIGLALVQGAGIGDDPHPLDLIREVVVEPGWLPWNGADGGPYIEKGMHVEVIFRDGSRPSSLPMEPAYLRWTWFPDGPMRDIVAYRVAPPAVEEDDEGELLVPANVVHVGDPMFAEVDGAWHEPTALEMPPEAHQIRSIVEIMAENDALRASRDLWRNLAQETLAANKAAVSLARNYAELRFRVKESEEAATSAASEILQLQRKIAALEGERQIADLLRNQRIATGAKLEREARIGRDFMALLREAQRN